MSQLRSVVPMPFLAQFTLSSVLKICPSLQYQVIEPVSDKNRFILQYFCPEALPNAPYGEGNAMVFLTGSSLVDPKYKLTHSYKFWYAWRPQSEKAAKQVLGIDEKKLNQYE